MVIEDSGSVRKSFRRICQRCSFMVALITAFCALALSWFDVPQWHLALIPTALCAPLHWMMSQHRPFWVFVVALLLLFLLLVGTCSHAALTIGRSSGLHLILTAILPVVVVSGRIGTVTKWLFVASFTGYLIVLDSLAVDPGLLDSASALTVNALRAVSLSIPVLCTTNLVLHYFRRASAQHAALLEMAMMDPLTGVYNRRQLSERARQLIADCHRRKQPFSVILCDLDHFKLLNDQYGHEAGDGVLTGIGEILGQGVRSVDCVGRWGGEEFLLLLSQTDIDGAYVVAERLRNRVAMRFSAPGNEGPAVTVTMGISRFRLDDTLETAVSRAYAALYAGKESGRNRVERASEDPNSLAAVAG